MAEPELLMVKLFKAHDHDYQDGSGGGKAFPPCVKVTNALRKLLATQVIDIADYFSASFQRWPHMPCVAKVTLRDTAYAKSKRPLGVFSDFTCPIIGGNRIGELYISVTPTGLRRLKNRFQVDDGGERRVSQISTIEEMCPYEVSDATGEESVASVRRMAEREPLKLQLFDHVIGSKCNTITFSCGASVWGRHQLPISEPARLFSAGS